MFNLDKGSIERAPSCFDLGCQISRLQVTFTYFFFLELFPSIYIPKSNNNMDHFPTCVSYRAAILFSKKSEKWISWLNYGFFVKSHRNKPPLKFNFLQEGLYPDSLCTLGTPRIIG